MSETNERCHGMTDPHPSQTPSGQPAPEALDIARAKAALADVAEWAAAVDRDEDDVLRDQMADLLTRTAAALKDEPAPLTLHDWSDLPRVAAEIRLAADLAHARYELPQEGAACIHRGQFIDFSGVCQMCRAEAAEQAVAAEREACAKVCDEAGALMQGGADIEPSERLAVRMGAQAFAYRRAAAAIRARGENGGQG